MTRYIDLRNDVVTVHPDADGERTIVTGVVARCSPCVGDRLVIKRDGYEITYAVAHRFPVVSDTWRAECLLAPRTMAQVGDMASRHFQHQDIEVFP